MTAVTAPSSEEIRARSLNSTLVAIINTPTGQNTLENYPLLSQQTESWLKDLSQSFRKDFPIRFFASEISRGVESLFLFAALQPENDTNRCLFLKRQALKVQQAVRCLIHPKDLTRRIVFFPSSENIRFTKALEENDKIYLRGYSKELMLLNESQVFQLWDWAVDNLEAEVVKKILVKIEVPKERLEILCEKGAKAELFFEKIVYDLIYTHASSLSLKVRKAIQEQRDSLSKREQSSLLQKAFKSRNDRVLSFFIKEDRLDENSLKTVIETYLKEVRFQGIQEAIELRRSTLPGPLISQIDFYQKLLSSEKDLAALHPKSFLFLLKNIDLEAMFSILEIVERLEVVPKTIQQEVNERVVEMVVELAEKKRWDVLRPFIASKSFLKLEAEDREMLKKGISSLDIPEDLQEAFGLLDS